MLWCLSQQLLQYFQAALNSPSLSVDFNGPKWLKQEKACLAIDLTLNMTKNNTAMNNDKEQHNTEQ